MDRYLLSTYVIKIVDNQRNEQILSHFNGTNDFYLVCENFLNSIFQTIQATSDGTESTTMHLTLDSPPIIDRENRRIYGYFSSGVSGEEYQIRDVSSRENILDVQRNHAAFRNLFFYLQIPSGHNSGALILQRKAKYGIKTILKRTINKYIKEQGFQIYSVQINNLLHGRVYRRMMDEGNLKKIEFIKKRIPATIEQYYGNGQNLDQIPGTLKTSMLSPTSLPQAFKNFVNNLFSNPANERIEINGIDEEFDEIEFELELNGKRKSFYIANRSKIQPDIDVTNFLEYEDGIPTSASFIAQAEELVQDIINIPINNARTN